MHMNNYERLYPQTFLSKVKNLKGLSEYGKSNPIIEYIKLDGIKIEYEISRGRKVVPGEEVRKDKNVQSNVNRSTHPPLKAAAQGESWMPDLWAH